MPFSKPGGGTPPPISTGSFVSWNGGSGRVNMVVTSGKVPGVSADVEGTAASPAARIVIWEKDSNGNWSATNRVTAAKTATLKRIAPLSSPAGKSADAVLVAMHTHYKDTADELGAPSYTVPDPAAVKTVYERGLSSWPEEKADVAREDWALSRVAAFFQMASGDGAEGYVRDVDLLPKAHPLRKE